MDPISMGLQVAGLGMSIFGAVSGASNASRESNISSQIMQDQEKEDAQREQQMEVSNRRQQMEFLRNTQRQRSMALATGVSQTGSTTGSGTQGGLDEVTSEGNTGLAGMQGSLMFGRNMFAINGQINGLKQQMSFAQSNDAVDQGIASMGKSFLTAGPTIGKMSQGFSFGGGGGNYSGTPGASNTGGLY